MSQKKILVVEDDLNLGFLLFDYLESANFKVKLCKDGLSGLAVLEKQRFDLCLLDVMMPNLDGFSVAKTIKQKGIEVPFIFLTAKSMKEDKLEGYDLGAEDYVTKPFDEEELLCKINVILRRNESDPFATAPSEFQIGNFHFNFKRQELKDYNIAHRLTEKESEVLRLLCLNQNKVLRRKDAVQKIYGKSDYFLGRSFDVYISRLRKLLIGDPSIEIQNIYKVGFMLVINETS
ncbi:UNVERIFIED_CONTAM: hypothetical protein GTU68_017230 [Idotea baltica]|nr:hypothetical protein [Idotea baltica]